MPCVDCNRKSRQSGNWLARTMSAPRTEGYCRSNRACAICREIARHADTSPVGRMKEMNLDQIDDHGPRKLESMDSMKPERFDSRRNKDEFGSVR